MEIHESTEKIRVRAHQLWEEAGRPHGHDVEHWLQAEREFLLNSTATAPLMEATQGLSDGEPETKQAKKTRTNGAPKAPKNAPGRSKANQPL